MLKLNAQGMNVSETAKVFNCHEHTVRAAIQCWKERGLVGLWSSKWKAEDLEYIETCLNGEKRTYNSIQLARLLKEERAVNLSSDRLQKILKKRYRWKPWSE